MSECSEDSCPPQLRAFLCRQSRELRLIGTSCSDIPGIALNECA